MHWASYLLACLALSQALAFGFAPPRIRVIEMRTRGSGGDRDASSSSSSSLAAGAAFEVPAVAALSSSSSEIQTPFGFVGASAKVLVSSSAMLLLLLTESWLPMYYILGGVVNAFISKVIKKIVKEPRPASSKKGGYGMPSSHAQALFYFFMTVALTSQRDRAGTWPWSLLSLVLGVYAVVASSWRVTSGLHSIKQTLVGAVIGVAFSLLVFRNEQIVLSSMLPAAFKTRVPMLFKLCVIGSGALVLYSKEIKNLRTSLQKSKA